MDLTLDYNVELFPLQKDQNFALALASSLVRGGSSGGNADDSAKDERDVWRPDGKGSRGLEDDYDYVMYGKVWISCRSLYLLTQIFLFAEDLQV
jgi:DNA-directed RNA polymerases I, II, and III subunit RPABC3